MRWRLRTSRLAKTERKLALMQVTQVPHHLFLVFTIAVVLGLMIQAGVFLVLFVASLRIIRKVDRVVDQLSSKSIPMLNQVQHILQDLTPKIAVISENLTKTSTTVREQVTHVNTTVDDVVDRSRAQVVRADEMVSAVLNSVVHATHTVHSGINAPVRQAQRVVNGLRVGLATLFAPRNGHATTERYAASEAHIHDVPEYDGDRFSSRRAHDRVESDDL